MKPWHDSIIDVAFETRQEEPRVARLSFTPQSVKSRPESEFYILFPKILKRNEETAREKRKRDAKSAQIQNSYNSIIISLTH